MGNGKYRIGARVRDWAGDEGVITEKRKSERQIRYDNQTYCQDGWFDKSVLTPIEPVDEPTPAAAPATEWVPKVGDRVRFTDECETYWWFGPHTKNTDGEIVGDGLDIYKFSVKTNDGTGYVNREHIELIADEPVVTVEAVEPATEQPATTDEVAPAKFKVGDKVRVVGSGYEFKRSHIGREFVIHSHCGELDGEDTWNGDIGSASQPYRWRESELELVPATKFKIGDVVNFTIDRNSWQGVTIDKVNAGGTYSGVDPATGNRGSFFESWIELATPAPAPTPTESFIVARLTSAGHPRPNARPRVHTSLDSANTEAQRLADQLGDEFAVYQRVDVRSVDAGAVPNKPVENFQRALRVPSSLSSAFDWSSTKQGWSFWSDQFHSGQLTPLGRAILRKWIATAQQPTTKQAA